MACVTDSSLCRTLLKYAITQLELNWKMALTQRQLVGHSPTRQWMKITIITCISPRWLVLPWMILPMPGECAYIGWSFENGKDRVSIMGRFTFVEKEAATLDMTATTIVLSKHFVLMPACAATLRKRELIPSRRYLIFWRLYCRTSLSTLQVVILEEVLPSAMCFLNS